MRVFTALRSGVYVCCVCVHVRECVLRVYMLCPCMCVGCVCVHMCMQLLQCICATVSTGVCVSICE